MVLITNSVSAQLVYNNGTDINILSGCNVIVKNGSFHNAVGTVNNSGFLTIEGAIINDENITGGSAGLFNVQGDFVNNDVFIASQSEVNLYGSDQLITGNSWTYFYNLTLTGTGIKKQTTNITVNNLLNINDRELATDNNLLYIANYSPNAIQRTSGFISSVGIGRLVRFTNSSNSYLFPVGSSLGIIRYRPVVLIPSPINTEYHIRMVNSSPTLDGFNVLTKDQSVLQVNSQFYHIIENTNSVSTDITLHYKPVEDGDWDINAHWQNLPQWEDMNNEIIGLTSNFSTITTSSWNSFYPFAFALSKRAEIESVFVPNAFTPQSDNLNDNFQVVGLGIEEISCKIFNRWGEMVYEIKDKDDYWDGQYKNKPAPQGIYTYVLNYILENNNGSYTTYGTLTLIR